MDKFRDFLNKLSRWRHSQKTRHALRTTESVIDTTAAGIGAVLRLCIRVVATVLLVILTTGLLFTCIFAVYVKTCMTEDLDISLEEASLSLSSTVWYKESDGTWHELATLYASENRTWVDYENIPLDLQHAAVAIEDKRFYEHKGVDWYRTVAAFVNMFVSMRDNFGGSTLTQQLIKNITEYDDVTVQRKLMEIFRALEFEKKYTKEEILTWYLNEIYLGEGCYGVNSAANKYFGKDVWELSTAECASLVSITNNPSLYDPYIYPTNNLNRRNTCLRQMYEQGYIDYDTYTEAVAEELVLCSTDEDNESNIVINSWYVETLVDDAVTDLAEQKGISTSQAEHLINSGGYNIYSCMDMRIQTIVDNYYENTANLPKAYRTSSQQLRSAMVIISPTTGDIVALAGNVGEKKANQLYNLATEAKRPPGSSFKPLSVYSPAIDTGAINQTTVFNDAAGLSLSGTTWYPKNSDGYSGYISVHTALKLSRNTVAAQILDLIGLSTSWDYLTNHYAITSLIPNDGTHSYTDYAYAPLSLGQLSEGITVREMAQAYTAFVNGGDMSYSRTYSVITDQDGNVVLDNPVRHLDSIKSNTAANMCDMLQDAVRSGTGTEAYISSTACGGKTGTTDSDKDRYFVGFTMYYVGAVWTGYETPERMYFSGNPACQIWKSIMSQVHSGYSYWDFPDYYIDSGYTYSYDYDDSYEETVEYEEDEEYVPEATTAPEPVSTPTDPCADGHTWVAVTETVHHDATGHYETQTHTTENWIEDSAAWEETVIDYDESGTEIGSHTVYHEATGHYETWTEEVWVADSSAWDETVTTGYRCSICGATQ